MKTPLDKNRSALCSRTAQLNRSSLALIGASFFFTAPSGSAATEAPRRPATVEVRTTDGITWSDVIVTEVTVEHLIFLALCHAEIPLADIVSPRLDGKIRPGVKFPEIRCRDGKVFRDVTVVGFDVAGGVRSVILLHRCRQALALDRIEMSCLRELLLSGLVVERCLFSGVEYRRVYFKRVENERILITHEWGVAAIPWNALPEPVRAALETGMTEAGNDPDAGRTIVTEDGVVYRRAVIIGKSAHGVAIQYEKGGAVIPAALLPPEMGEELGIDSGHALCSGPESQPRATYFPPKTEQPSPPAGERQRILAEEARRRQIALEKERQDARYQEMLKPAVKVEITPAGGGRWVAVYEAQGRAGRRSFDTKKEAETWVAHQRERHTLLAATGTTVKLETRTNGSRAAVPTAYALQQRQTRAAPSGSGSGGSYTSYGTYRYYRTYRTYTYTIRY